MAKEIHLAKWNGNTLVYSIPNKNNPERLADFQGRSKFLKFVYANQIHASLIVDSRNADRICFDCVARYDHIWVEAFNLKEKLF